ncbi:MAG: hypothetical protein KIT50_16295 [Bacteroidetes bacterium]|nr:hypothetical protein [Bacteroidota bacterium]
MKPTKLFNMILVLSFIFLLSAFGEKKSETREAVLSTTLETGAPQKVEPAKSSARLIAYYKKAVAWTESAECRDIKKKKDLGGFFAKLIDIAKSVGYEGDANAVNKQISSDQRAFKKDPEVKEWDKKFQKAMK